MCNFFLYFNHFVWNLHLPLKIVICFLFKVFVFMMRLIQMQCSYVVIDFWGCMMTNFLLEFWTESLLYNKRKLYSLFFLLLCISIFSCEWMLTLYVYMQIMFISTNKENNLDFIVYHDFLFFWFDTSSFMLNGYSW